MQMSDDEIRKSYREAKNQFAQVKILAELNACPEKEIDRILMSKSEETQETKPLRETTPRPYKKNGSRMATIDRNELFLSLYNEKKTDSQIAHQVGCTPSNVAQWRVKRKLPSNFVKLENKKETFVVPKDGTPRKDVQWESEPALVSKPVVPGLEWQEKLEHVPDVAELGLPLLKQEEPAIKQVPIAQDPPVGLRSKHAWMRERYNEILDAISRYRQAGMFVPLEWLHEAAGVADDITRIQS